MHKDFGRDLDPGSAAVEERPDEIAGAVALLGPRLADGVIDDEDEANAQSAPCPVGQEAAEEDDGHDGEDATVADDIISPAAAAIDTNVESNAALADEATDTAASVVAAARPDEGTPAAETIDADGQPASDTAPGDDTAVGNSGEAEAAADDVRALHPILNVGKGELIPAGEYTGRVDVDKFASFWFGSYLIEDYLVIEARLADQGEYIACLNGKGQLLTDPTLHVYAERFGVPIRYRIYKDLTEAESRAFVLDSQDGGRLQTAKERRQLKHARVRAYLEIGAESDNRLSFAEIGRRVGYTEARVRQIHREHQKPTDRNISDSEASEASATASNSTAPPKKPKDKKIPATTPMAAAEAPLARKSSATGTSRVTSRNPKSAQGLAAPPDFGFDEDELVDTAMDRCGIKQAEKSEWQAAGRQLLAERRENCPSGHQTVLKIAVRALVELRMAADAAEAWLKELLRTNAGEVA